MKKFIYCFNRCISYKCNEISYRILAYNSVNQLNYSNHFYYQKIFYSLTSKSTPTLKSTISILDEEIATIKKKPLKKFLIRADILNPWFENVCTLLKSNSQMVIKWNEINSELISPIQEHFKDKWPLIVLSYLVAFQERVPGLFENAMNLIEYVKSLDIIKNQMILNIMTIAILFNQGDNNDIKKGLLLYEDLRKNITILDDTLGLALIRIISNTSYWSDCFKYLQMIELSSRLNSSHITPLLIASTRHNDFDNKEKLLFKLKSSLLIPNDEYFKYMLMSNCEILFHEMQQFNWLIYEESASIIKDTLNNYDFYDVVEASIINGKCDKCNIKLPKLLEINEKDFNELKKEFEDKVFCKKGNIFINSSSVEMDKFQKFSLENSNFDVVIDALNVRDRISQKASKKYKDLNLLKVIAYFEEKKKKVLVLSRKHLKQIKTSSAIWFFTDNLSADDTFGLFMALNSKSRGAFYVSSDFLRDHSTLLGSRLASIFNIWQQGHQIMFNGLNQKGDPIFRWPEKHDIKPYIYKDSIHIPYRSRDRVIKFQSADKWLCIKRKSI